MIPWIKKYYVQIMIGVVLIGMVVSGFVKPAANTQVNLINNQENERIVETVYIYVDIKGAVWNPGVYKVEKDSRLFQVIQLAGGLTDEADPNAMNFSIILADQDVVYIPRIDEEFPNITTIDDSTIGGVVNINTANADVLESLPGIGPATAQNIIDYRNENGPFNAIEDIMNVSGIGEATFNEIKDLITV